MTHRSSKKHAIEENITAIDLPKDISVIKDHIAHISIKYITM